MKIIVAAMLLASLVGCTGEVETAAPDGGPEAGPEAAAWCIWLACAPTGPVPKQATRPGDDGTLECCFDPR